MTIRVGTRSSKLAMWQATTVRDALEAAGFETELVPLTSSGDRSLGGQLSASVGQFIHSIDDRLLANEFDIAVHSCKDVPIDVDDSIQNLAYLERGPTFDVILMRKTQGVDCLKEMLANTKVTPLKTILEDFPYGATFGTVSGRRQSFLLSQRPDIIPLAVRGHVETRIARLMEGRVDAVVLAEVGIQRLDSIGALDDVMSEISAFRIDPADWPTAPGQGSIAIHCKRERYDDLQNIREVLNHIPTEIDVCAERELLKQVGGGCLFPAGIEVMSGHLHLQVSPENWREIFCQGTAYKMLSYDGPIEKLELQLPRQGLMTTPELTTGPRYISTLNSDRISLVLANSGIAMQNISVVDLVPKIVDWPADFLRNHAGKKTWPYLVLTSPFAAKCAVRAARKIPDIGRIPWIAIGEGTARACFRLGVTVSVCAKARNARHLASYIIETFPSTTSFLIPRSSRASTNLEETLISAGYSVSTWIGYENSSKEIEQIEVEQEDVLVLSSASSAISWAENNLMVPHEILCMGENAKRTIASLDHFSGCRVSVLNGPTSEALVQWWQENRGYSNED